MAYIASKINLENHHKDNGKVGRIDTATGSPTTEKRVAQDGEVPGKWETSEPESTLKSHLFIEWLEKFNISRWQY